MPPEEEFPGFSNLLGPEGRLGSGRVVSPETYKVWHSMLCKERGDPAWLSSRIVNAEVNHGRWMVTCVSCQEGALTNPEWGVAYCGQCGASYEQGQIEFPDAVDEITRLLCLRPDRSTQNWTHESVEELQSENIEHGVGV